MKYLVSALFILLTVSLFSEDFANEPLMGYKKDNLWYVINHDGEKLFELPHVEKITSYSEGFYTLKFDETHPKYPNQWAYANRDGKVTIVPEADLVKDFKEGRAVILKIVGEYKKSKQFGFIDTTGKVVVPVNLIYASDFKEGRAYCMDFEKNKFYLDRSGNKVLTLDSLVGYPYSEGLACITTKALKCGYMNTAGEIVIDMKFDEPGEFSEGLAHALVYDKVGFIDTTGNYVIEKQFDLAKPFKEGRAVVGFADHNYKFKYAYINKSGERLCEVVYDWASDYNDSMALVMKDGKLGYLNHEGQEAIAPVYNYALDFANGIAYVSTKENNLKAYIDKSGETVFEVPEFEKAIDFRVNKTIR
jgi:hypothetical protein